MEVLAVELDDPFLDVSGFLSMLASSAEMEVFFASFMVSLLFLALTFAPFHQIFSSSLQQQLGKYNCEY